MWWVAAALADDRAVLPEGMSPVAVMAIAQDADGWLWFGGVDGLWRYDGARKARWGDVALSIEPIEIVSIDGDHATVLAQDRHLYDVGPETTTRVSPPTPSGTMWHAASSDGAIWAVAEDALFRRQGEAWVAVPTPVVPRLVRTAAAGVWVLGDATIVRIDRDGQVLEAHPIPQAIDVATDATGGWAVSRTQGVWRWDASGVRQLAGWGQEWGQSVVIAPGGAWVSSTRRVLRFEDDRVAHELQVPRGLPQHDSLLIDREGSLWVASNAGPLLRAAPDAWRLDTPGLLDPGITWLAPVGDVVWVASWGVAGRFEGERWARSPRWIAYSWPMCAVDGGHLAIAYGPDHTALVHLGPETDAEVAPLPFGAQGYGCDVGTGGTWVALDHGLHHLGPAGLVPVPSPVVKPQTLVVDDNGLLHVLGVDRECHADAALALVGAAAWTCAAPWSTAWAPNSAAEVSPGRVWAAGMSTGLLEETPTGWTRHPSSNLLASPSLRAIIPTSDGVWLYGIGGATRVRPGPIGAPWTTLERLAPALGAATFSTNHAFETRDGGLWLATDVGVVTVPASARRPPSTPPAPVFAEVWSDGHRIAAGPIEAAWPHNQIELRAATATYADRTRLRWRVRIGDAPPTESPEDTVRIVDLPAGIYVIQVAVSADGGATWSAPSAPLVVTVPLPWFLRPPALIAAALLAAGAVVAAWRIRLEAALRVERERTRIAMDLHDDLGAGLSTITMLTGLAADRDLDDEARREVAGEAATTAATLTDALADIVWTLRRDAGQGGTLARSLVDRARRLFASGETKLVVDVAAEWPDRALALALYRNVQLIGYEALGNAARHAAATTVTLRFHPWTLEIEDDGRGLAAPSPKAGTGTGLASMKARAAAVGATLDVLDRPGGGTIVRVRFRP